MSHVDAATAATNLLEKSPIPFSAKISITTIRWPRFGGPSFYQTTAFSLSELSVTHAQTIQTKDPNLSLSLSLSLSHTHTATENTMEEQASLSNKYIFLYFFALFFSKAFVCFPRNRGGKRMNLLLFMFLCFSEIFKLKFFESLTNKVSSAGPI